MNMNIETLVDNFSLFEDWEDKYRYLIELGEGLPPMDESLKTETSKVRGCMSQVWMILTWDKDRRLRMLADSDAQIVRGLIAVLYAAYDGADAEQAAKLDIQKLFADVGLDQHISPNRRNGFFSMVERIKAFVSMAST